jgi:hypothetical protein
MNPRNLTKFSLHGNLSIQSQQRIQDRVDRHGGAANLSDVTQSGFGQGTTNSENSFSGMRISRWGLPNVLSCLYAMAKGYKIPEWKLFEVELYLDQVRDERNRHPPNVKAFLDYINLYKERQLRLSEQNTSAGQEASA